MDLSKLKALSIDPLVQGLTKEAIEADVATYLGLLDDKVPEADVHSFLASHTYFFNGALRLFSLSAVYSRVKLGAEYEVDFAFPDSSSFGIEWSLVELEAPDKRMFTQAGDPTADLTHGIQQVRNWHSWIHENLDYARKLMPNIEYPLGYLFIGRREQLTDDSKQKLRRLAYDHRMYLRIHTLDWFAGAAMSVETLVRDGRGTWPVPMKALGHADLADQKPALVHEWLRDPRISAQSDWQRELAELDRRSNYLLFAEYREEEDES